MSIKFSVEKPCVKERIHAGGGPWPESKEITKLGLAKRKNMKFLKTNIKKMVSYCFYICTYDIIILCNYDIIAATH